jgi:hypothetical protein
MAGPLTIGIECASHCRRKNAGYGWMNPKQYDARLYDGFAALKRDLPEVAVKREYNPAIRFRLIEQSRILRAGRIGANPSYIVPATPQFLNRRKFSSASSRI